MATLAGALACSTGGLNELGALNSMAGRSGSDNAVGGPSAGGVALGGAKSGGGAGGTAAAVGGGAANAGIGGSASSAGGAPSGGSGTTSGGAAGAAIAGAGGAVSFGPVRFLELEPTLPPMQQPVGAPPVTQVRRNTSITDATPDASVIVGDAAYESSDGDVFAQRRAFIWREASGVQSLGEIAATTRTSVSDIWATHVTADGLRVFGAYNVIDPTLNVEQSNVDGFFVWTEAKGFVNLGQHSAMDTGELSSFSADGNSALGFWVPTANKTSQVDFLWTDANGYVPLANLPAWPQGSVAQGLSSDGSSIIGFTGVIDEPKWFRWRKSGVVWLGSLPNYPYCSLLRDNSPLLVSADASVISGTCVNALVAAVDINGPFAPRHAFRWTEATGMVALDATGSLQMHALGMSQNGDLIVGSAVAGVVPAPGLLVWTPEQGITQVLGEGASATSAYYPGFGGTASDGRASIGDISDPNFPNLHDAFHWRMGTAIQGLEVLPGDASNEAYAQSPDGLVVAGVSEGLNRDTAVLWDQLGIRNIGAEATATGVDLKGLQPQRAQGVAVGQTALITYGGGSRQTTDEERAWVAWLPKR